MCQWSVHCVVYYSEIIVWETSVSGHKICTVMFYLVVWSGWRAIYFSFILVEVSEWRLCSRAALHSLPNRRRRKFYVWFSRGLIALDTNVRYSSFTYPSVEQSKNSVISLRGAYRTSNRQIIVFYFVYARFARVSFVYLARFVSTLK